MPVKCLSCKDNSHYREIFRCEIFAIYFMPFKSTIPVTMTFDKRSQSSSLINSLGVVILYIEKTSQKSGRQFAPYSMIMMCLQTISRTYTHRQTEIKIYFCYKFSSMFNKGLFFTLYHCIDL